MLFKLDKNAQKYFDVQKLYGNSYSYVGLNIDGPNEEIHMKIKQMQAKEFGEVAEMRLFHQKQHFRHKLMMERRKKQEKSMENQYESNMSTPTSASRKNLKILRSRTLCR